MSIVSISVLMPVYNAERYLAQAVESVLAQTFERFEFLIVDDGSSDQSLPLLKRYAGADSRIRLMSRPNTGYCVALNEMLGLARGEFVARMDADDVSMPDRFEQQLAWLRKRPEVVCVGGAVLLIDEKGRALHRLQPPCADRQAQAAALAGHTPICHPAAMMRREPVLRVGGYDDGMVPAEDLDLWLRLGEVGELANLDVPVLKYRLHSASISQVRQQQQVHKLREACERAWVRRGVTATFEASEPWRPTADTDSQYKFMLRYGWWAYNGGERCTAAIYAAKAIRLKPLAWGGWNLLRCAGTKPMPSQRPQASA